MKDFVDSFVFFLFESHFLFVFLLNGKKLFAAEGKGPEEKKREEEEKLLESVAPGTGKLLRNSLRLFKL